MTRSGGASGAAGQSALLEPLRDESRRLDPKVQSEMEAELAAPFGDVIVHTGAASATAADDFDAAAFTVGRHIVFGRQRFALDTPRGRTLLAHELAHVNQQRRGGGDLDSGERMSASALGVQSGHSEAAAHATAHGAPAVSAGSAGVGVARQSKSDEKGAAAAVKPARVFEYKDLTGAAKHLSEDEAKKLFADQASEVRVALTRIKGYAAVGQETHEQYVKDNMAESVWDLANSPSKWAATASNMYGGVVPPSILMWGYPIRTADAALAIVSPNDLRSAERELQRATNLLRDAQDQWQTFIEASIASGEKVVDRLRHVSRTSLGFVEGVVGEVTQIVDTGLWIVEKTSNAIDYVDDKTDELSGVPKEVRERKKRDNPGAYSLLKGFAAKGGFVDKYTGTIAISPKMHETFDRVDKFTMEGVPASDSLLDEHDYSVLAGSFGTQGLLAFSGEAEVKLVLKISSGAGAVKGVWDVVDRYRVTDGALSASKLAGDPDFAVAMGEAFVWVFGLNGGKTGDKLVKLLVAMAPALFKSAREMVRVVDAYGLPEGPEREAELKAAAIGMLRLLGSTVMHKLKEQKEAKSRQAAQPAEETAPTTEGQPAQAKPGTTSQPAEPALEVPPMTPTAASAPIKTTAENPTPVRSQPGPDNSKSAPARLYATPQRTARTPVGTTETTAPTTPDAPVTKAPSGDASIVVPSTPGGPNQTSTPGAAAGELVPQRVTAPVESIPKGPPTPAAKTEDHPAVATGSPVSNRSTPETGEPGYTSALPATPEISANATAQQRAQLLETLRLVGRAKSLLWNAEKGKDDLREAQGKVRVEQALGRQLENSTTEGIDIIDPRGVGAIQLKGPLPVKGDYKTFADSAVHDLKYSSAAQVLAIDLTGLSPEAAAYVRQTVDATPTTKKIIYVGSPPNAATEPSPKGPDIPPTNASKSSSPMHVEKPAPTVESTGVETPHNSTPPVKAANTSAPLVETASEPQPAATQKPAAESNPQSNDKPSRAEARVNRAVANRATVGARVTNRNERSGAAKAVVQKRLDKGSTPNKKQLEKVASTSREVERANNARSQARKEERTAKVAFALAKRNTAGPKSLGERTRSDWERKQRPEQQVEFGARPGEQLHHAIELQVLDIPEFKGAFDPHELTRSNNIRLIPMEVNPQDAALLDIARRTPRADWPQSVIDAVEMVPVRGKPAVQRREDEGRPTTELPVLKDRGSKGRPAQLHQSEVRSKWDGIYAALRTNLNLHEAKGELLPGTPERREHIRSQIESARDYIDWGPGQFFGRSREDLGLR